MQDIKYVGIDLHQSSCLIAVHNMEGRCIMRNLLETREKTIRSFFRGMEGTVHVAFEVGCQSAWLYEVMKPLVTSVTVCNARKLKSGGNKNDEIDANKLATLLRAGMLKSVYQGNPEMRRLRDVAHGYLAINHDLTRTMCRIKALYRGWSIPSPGRDVYCNRNRDCWLQKLPTDESRFRAQLYYRELDLLRQEKQEARKRLLHDSRKYPIQKVIRKVPGFGPIRTALAIAIIATPARFRTKRQLWSYIGMGIIKESSSDFAVIAGRFQRRKGAESTRGLTRDYNRIGKWIFKSAAKAAVRKEPFGPIYLAMIARGIRPEMAILTVTRKIAAIVLAIWKKGESFDVAKLRH